MHKTFFNSIFYSQVIIITFNNHIKPNYIDIEVQMIVIIEVADDAIFSNLSRQLNENE